MSIKMASFESKINRINQRQTTVQGRTFQSHGSIKSDEMCQVKSMKIKVSLQINLMGQFRDSNKDVQQYCACGRISPVLNQQPSVITVQHQENYESNVGGWRSTEVKRFTGQSFLKSEKDVSWQMCWMEYQFDKRTNYGWYLWPLCLSSQIFLQLLFWIKVINHQESSFDMKKVRQEPVGWRRCHLLIYSEEPNITPPAGGRGHWKPPRIHNNSIHWTRWSQKY